MILSFELENWMSFKETATFSMVASREKQHLGRVPYLEKYKTHVLPVAAIYGGNASGKTNFFKALKFVRDLVVKGTHPDAPLVVEPFRLDAICASQPSRFGVVLLVDEVIYDYSFTVSRKAVLAERLVQVLATTEKELYARTGDAIRFHPSLDKDDFLHFAFRGTRSNQLFLTNAVSQKVEHFKPVYDWFKNRLEMVAPDSRFEFFEQFLDEGQPLFATLNDWLTRLDTGILNLGGESVPVGNLNLPDSLRTLLEEDVKEGMSVRLMLDRNERMVITRKDGDLLAKKLVTFHPTADGGRVQFEMAQESDGSQRVIDLLPAFLELSSSPSHKVYVIDEVDRSLHTLLTRRLLDAYLSTCAPGTRSQLLLTTHDVLTMDQDLLRRDEMWVAERQRSGASRLFSFSDFKNVRSDKDIRKSYLQGRLGGVPKLLLGSGALLPTANLLGQEGLV